MYRKEYDKALKESAKFKSKGLRLDETRWHDVFEEAIKKAKRWDEAREKSLKYPWVKDVIEVLKESNIEEREKRILTDIVHFKQNETDHLYNMIAVMSSTDTRQLEVNLKRKIIEDLRMFFISGFYDGRGYENESMQEILDLIYSQMKDWYFAFDAGEISNGNEC